MKRLVRRYRAGDVIGKWKVLGELGAGAMGIVYQVEHRSMQKPAALKVLKVTGPKADIMAAKMLDEARLLASSKHPNLVEVYDACDDGGDEWGYWMVMEKLQGRELSDVIKDDGPLSLERVLHLTEQMASAASCAHEMGVVHRDLKPDNVFVSDKEVVKVIDFGASQFKQGMTLNMIVGTVPYMSPEQLRKVPDLDGRSDIYALGLIVHEMLTGRHLFRLPDGKWRAQNQMFYSTLSPEPISPFEDVEPRVRPILLRAAAKDRDARYQSMDALAADVAQLRAAISHTYAPTQRLTEAAVSSAKAAISAARSANTKPMTSTETAAVIQANQAPAGPGAQGPTTRSVPGSYLVIGGMLMLLIGMGVILLLTAPPAPNAASDSAAAAEASAPRAAAASATTTTTAATTTAKTVATAAAPTTATSRAQPAATMAFEPAPSAAPNAAAAPTVADTTPPTHPTQSPTSQPQSLHPRPGPGVQPTGPRQGGKHISW